MNHRVRMYTTQWCGDCFRAKTFLKQQQVPFEEIPLETTPGAA